MNTIIITHYNDKLLTAESDERGIIDLYLENNGEYNVDDVFTGRVDSIADNINSAFIKIGDNKKCFYQIHKGETLKVGDELPVQIIKDAVKTKDAECNTKISIPGKYVVVTEGKYSLGISAKIPDDDWKFDLQQQFDVKYSYDDEFGFIIRTNAHQVEIDDIFSEAECHINLIKEIRKKSKSEALYKKLFCGESYYLSKIRDSHVEVKVVTDDKDVFEQIKDTFPKTEISLYEDDMVSLMKLYKIESAIAEAFNKKVWLKCGGYLVIEETEAMTVIDVNTGKMDNHGDTETTFLKTNIEAAFEVARQIRLRNISGIIIVDFIDMKKQESMDKVIGAVKQAIYSDPVKVNYVDVTKLNLIELTRKKVYKSLSEMLN